MWNLLAAVAVRPLPQAFNTTAPALVSQFEGAAAAVQVAARTLFGEAFFEDASVVEVTNRFPAFLGAALLELPSFSGADEGGDGDGRKARVLSAAVVAKVEREAARVMGAVDAAAAGEVSEKEAVRAAEVGVGGEALEPKQPPRKEKKKTTATMTKKKKSLGPAEALALKFRTWYAEQYPEDERAKPVVIPQ